MNENIHNLMGNLFIPGFLHLKKNQYLISLGLMLFFALIGFTISLFFKPIYEAEAVLLTNLELVRDGNITEIMVDSQLEILRRQVTHSDVVAKVITSERINGNDTTMHELYSNVSIERRLMGIYVKVRDEDPAVAARVASTWVEAAYDRMNIAYEYALEVSEAKWMLTTIEDCTTDPVVAETGFCQSLDPQEVKELSREANKTILSKGIYALGLTKDMQIGQFQVAAIPEKPIQGERPKLILYGALIGLFLSFIFYELPSFKEVKDEHDLFQKVA